MGGWLEGLTRKGCSFCGLTDYLTHVVTGLKPRLKSRNYPAISPCSEGQ